MCFTWCHIHFQANLCCSAREFFGGEACHLVKLQHTRLLRHCGELRHDHVLGSCAAHIEQHARVPGRPLYRLYLELEVVHDHTLAALVVYPCSIESIQSLSLFALVFRRTLYGAVVRPRDSVCVTGAEVQDDPYFSAGPPRTSQMTDRAPPPAQTVVEPSLTKPTTARRAGVFHESTSTGCSTCACRPWLFCVANNGRTAIFEFPTMSDHRCENNSLPPDTNWRQQQIVCFAHEQLVSRRMLCDGSSQNSNQIVKCFL